MSDSNTTIEHLRALLKDFRDKRDWNKFHNPKDISMAISAEVGELLELFLWQSTEDISNKIKNDPEFRKCVEEELADIFIFCINFANSTNFDISEIVQNKIEKNNKKYNPDKVKGTATKYNKL